MDADDYQRQAEDFLAAVNDEYFQHDAGLKQELEVAPIYRRYGALFEQDLVLDLLRNRTSRDGRYLAQFAAFGFVENSLREITDRIATAEARATITWDGRSVPYRQSRMLLANEPGLERRRELEGRIAEATEPLNPDLAMRVKGARRAASELRFRSYAAMCDELAGLSLPALYSATGRLLADTTDLYAAALEAHLSAAGIPAEGATAADFAFLRRGHAFDTLFPKEELMPALERTLAGLGVELATQPNVTLDIAERPLKLPRAFCAPVRVPGDVRLAIRPQGGLDDYLRLFHEAGHLEHFAHARVDAPFAFRCLGDYSVTEAYAFLLGKLPTTPAWMADTLGREAPAEYLALSKLTDLYYIRRYCAKLAYEIELHAAGDPGAVRPRYARILGEALRLACRPEFYLYDVDDFFYCACYLRAWILEAQLRRRLIADFGREWFTKRRAGDYLKELWALGQELTAEEVAQCVGYRGLEHEALTEDLSSPEE